MEYKVSREAASAEVESWLDKKKVYQTTRESQKESIDLLIEAMMFGDLTLDSKTFEFKHKLLIPEALNNEILEFTYKVRLTDKMTQPHLQGVKANDAEGRFTAICSALTTQPKAIISGLDTADKKIMMSIAVFFL